MAAQSTAAAFALALKNQLASRFSGNANASLRTVTVRLVHAQDTAAIEVVTLIDGPVDGSQDYFAGGVRSDQYSFPARIEAYATGSDTDTAFQTAWARAALILDEVILELQQNPPQVGINTEETHVSAIRYLPAPGDKGGWIVRCNFTVEYRALVS